MLRVQVLLLAALVAGAAEPAVGEAGLAELAAARASVTVVAGEGTQTVTRIDEPDDPGEVKAVRFAVAADGRYDIVMTDPAEPTGERTRLLSDGHRAYDMSQMAVGELPQWHDRPAVADLTSRLLACLRLDPVQLRRDYTVELAAAADGLRELRLVPSDPAVAREITRVVLAIDAAGRPTRVVLDDLSGNRRRILITSFRDDPPLDPAWFKGP